MAVDDLDGADVGDVEDVGAELGYVNRVVF